MQTSELPGVAYRVTEFFEDVYTGSADALVASGLVEFHELPGQPGRPRSMVSYRAPGPRLPGRYDRRFLNVAFMPGYRCVKRHVDGYMVRLTVSLEEQDRRQQAHDAAHQPDRREMLVRLHTQGRAVDEDLLSRVTPRCHLALVWSRP